MPISQHAATQPLPTIPGFTLSELLYDGPKTATYRAQSSQKNQNVIIKVLQQEYPSFSDLVQFRNQYTLTHNLPIPNVIRSLSLEPWQNGYALVMEDFGGISLADHVKAQPPSLIETLAIGVQMAEILHDLGQHRLIHKDIKPANILIHPDSRQVKLTDFSISSLLPKETQSVQHPNELAKGLEGTLAYLAPEQTGRMNRGIDYRADFYALGVTLYELLVGELPFESEDPLALVHAHIATPPVAPHQRQPAIPPMVSDIVLKLMAKNAEDRYQSAKGLKHDLERSLHQWKETETIDPFELGRQDVCDRFLIPEKLYGREQEVQTLLSAFDRTASGSLEMMLVAGFSGIGKTAVVNEVHKPITRLQGYFISGKYDQFNRDLPLSAFVQAFRGLIKQLLGTSEEQLGNWRRKILEAVGDNGQLLIAVIPELVQVIGPQPPVNELAGTAAQNRFNRLFQQFISIFATAEHPLVVFLDDLQWADATSLYLLERLLGKGEQGHLLIIGAYRDNEVSAAHPLMLTLDKLAKEHATINTISLAPLSQDSLNTLVANTLQCASSAATPITQLIYQKTQGNPFFSTQFLKALYDNQLITFDWEAGGWQCDVAQVKAQTLTDDVVEFMAGQLKKLSPKTQQVLKLSACIGNRFDLATLAIVHEKSRAETAIDLWSALQAGLIVPTSEVYKFYQSQADQTQKEQTHEKSRRDTAADCSNAEANSTYRFLHDRVQQAAYSLIPEEQKKRTHFKVGQRLSQVLSAEEQTEKLFEIVNQLNFGQAFVMSPAEKENLIRLNLAAGRKAKASTAYGAAVQYFAVGRALLGGNGWQTDYGLSLSLYEEAAEAAYLNTDFEQSEQLSSVVLQQANTLLDKINVYIAKIQSRISQANLIGALQIALPVLTLLDSSFSLPETPTPDDFQQAFAETQSTLAGRSTRDLLDLPTMEAPHQLATIRILSSIAPPAYIGFPALLPLIAMRMVDLSVKFGNTPSSAFGYAMYGFILCGVMDDIESGYPMSQLALDLVDKYNAQHIKAKVLLLAGHFINPWKDNIHENMQLLPKAYQAGLASGDLEFSAYAAGFYCFNAVFTAKPLKGLDEELSAYADAIASIKQNHTLPYISISRQVVLNLLQQTEHPTRLVGEAYDESSMVEHHKKTNNRTALAFFYTAKLNLAYLFGDCERAKTYAAKAQEYLDGVVAMFCIVLVNFYDSLVKLALYPQAEDAEQRYILEQVAQNQLKMKYWADNAPVNYLHKFYLVEAERDRVLGNKASALENYDLAIADAKAHGFCQDEAIANELAANFYLAWEKTSLAKTYLNAAYYGYIRWGAKAKTSQLEQQPLLQSILHSELHPTSGAWSTS
ncbi:MAG: serine/threonine-protein kinase PknK, partial [Cyanobacteria bacterium J06649_4]